MKQSSVLKGKITEIFINREDAVSVLNVTSLKDIDVVRSMEYLLPQEGQKRLW